MGKSVLREKSFELAVVMIKVCEYLRKTKREHTLANQLLRSGTSVGANINEAQYAESEADFIHKMRIALKEVNETIYWLELLVAANILTIEDIDKVINLTNEIKSMLISTIKTMKKS